MAPFDDLDSLFRGFHSLLKLALGKLDQRARLKEFVLHAGAAYNLAADDGKMEILVLVSDTRGEERGIRCRSR